jgi:hypothetical protein
MDTDREQSERQEPAQTRSLAERNCLPKTCHSSPPRDPGRAQRKIPAQGALLMIDLTSKLNRVGNRVQASLPDARPFLSSRNARLACISGRNYS